MKYTADNKKITEVWAHRGASAYAPENTLEAFQKAIDMGADGVELDIQLSKDGEIVVIHDEQIGRVSDGTGWVKDYTLEELRTYNFNKTHPEYSRVLIPTLEEVYRLLEPTGMTVNVELKTGVVFYDDIERKALELANRMNMKEKVIYSSFNHYTVMKIKELDPMARSGFLFCDGWMGVPEYAALHKVDALHPALYNVQYEGFIEECRGRGIELNVWTVNEEKHMKKLCDMGVDSIITNYPDVAVRVVREYFDNSFEH